MRVLLDENVDWRLRRSLDPSFHVKTVKEMGWNGISNGDLLREAESRFDVIVTLDSNMQYQQHVESLDVAIIVIAGRSTRLEDIEPATTEINKNIRDVRAGTVVRLEV